MVPACRSLDCVSIFALTCEDAAQILDICAGYDQEDALSRRAPATAGSFAPAFRFAVPQAADLEFFGDEGTPALFAAAAAALEGLGGTRIDIDFSPFRSAGALLYDGPWIAERLAAIEEFFRSHSEELLPVTRRIIAAAADYRAVDAFKASYRLSALRRASEPVWRDADLLLLPTAGTIYTVAEVEAQPLELNARLGRYTNFVNLLDLAAIAVPAGFRSDGLPFGVSLVAPAFSDAALARLGAALHRRLDLPLGATPDRLPPDSPEAKIAAGEKRVEIAVVGGHLSGMPLNRELLDQGARLVCQARTAAVYRMFRLDGEPPRPGLVRSRDGGRSIEIEIWSLSVAGFGAFVAAVPPPLAIGTLVLDTGRQVKGFLCEAEATNDAEDITPFGGWRAYLAGLRG